MLATNKIPAALFAIHMILIKARHLAAEGASPALLSKLLDWAEILPTLITRRADEDTTEEFRETLAGLGEEFPDCAGLLSNFDRGVTWDAYPSAGQTVPA